jgi:hypothetical protein
MSVPCRFDVGSKNAFSNPTGGSKTTCINPGENQTDQLFFLPNHPTPDAEESRSTTDNTDPTDELNSYPRYPHYPWFRSSSISSMVELCLFFASAFALFAPSRLIFVVRIEDRCALAA